MIRSRLLHPVDLIGVAAPFAEIVVRLLFSAALATVMNWPILAVSVVAMVLPRGRRAMEEALAAILRRPLGPGRLDALLAPALHAAKAELAVEGRDPPRDPGILVEVRREVRATRIGVSFMNCDPRHPLTDPARIHFESRLEHAARSALGRLGMARLGLEGWAGRFIIFPEPEISAHDLLRAAAARREWSGLPAAGP